MKKASKLFFKKIIKSIKGFENYQDLIEEQTIKTVSHNFIFILIISILILCSTIPQLNQIVEQAIQLASTNLEINTNNMYMPIYVLSCLFFIIINYMQVLANILMLSILGYTSSRIIGLKLNYNICYKFANYSIVLPVILQCIYYIVNSLTGYTITYFQIIYVLISYIYMISAIIIMKIDLINRKKEIEILEEQQKNIVEGIDYNEEK